MCERERKGRGGLFRLGLPRAQTQRFVRMMNNPSKAWVRACLLPVSLSKYDGELLLVSNLAYTTCLSLPVDITPCNS